LSNLNRLGKRSLVFGLLTFSVPFGFGLLAGKILGLSLIASCIIGLIFSPHVLIAYPTIIRLGLAQKEYIGVTVGATAITSVLTLVGFSIVQGGALGNLGPLFWLKILLGLPLLILISLWTVPKLGKPLINENQSDLKRSFTFILATLFVISGLTTLLGVDAIVGAFVAGLVLNPLVPLNSQLMDRIEFVGNGIFIPCFMVSVGLLCNPRIFVSNPGIISVTLLIFALSFIGKAVPATLISRVFSYSAIEGLTVFSLTMARAALVVVIALFAQKFDLISSEIFNAAIAYILLTCLTGTILTEWIAPKLASAEAVL
ncbi:MAG: cation:proton antiporter, partial [Cyanobacteria bacterium P01_F01_bin.42]